MSVSEDARVIVQTWRSFNRRTKIWFKKHSDDSIELIVQHGLHYYNYLCLENDYYLNVMSVNGKNKWDPKKGTHYYSLEQITETVPRRKIILEERSTSDIENIKPMERKCENCLQFKLDKCFVKGSQEACEDFQPSKRNWVGHEDILQSRLRGAY